MYYVDVKKCGDTYRKPRHDVRSGTFAEADDLLDSEKFIAILTII